MVSGATNLCSTVVERAEDHIPGTESQMALSLFF